MLAALGRLTARVGIGLAAGVAGTSAMTLAQTIEMKMTGREGSTVPADVVDEIAHIAPKEDAARSRMANLSHWGYGTSLGGLRGVLASTPLPPVWADVLFFAGVWTAPMVYLPAMEVSPPPTEWGAKQIATDAALHLCYAATVATAWRLLTRSRPVRKGLGLFS